MSLQGLANSAFKVWPIQMAHNVVNNAQPTLEGKRHHEAARRTAGWMM